jgi:hypothetical protein
MPRHLQDELTRFAAREAGIPPPVASREDRIKQRVMKKSIGSAFSFPVSPEPVACFPPGGVSVLKRAIRADAVLKLHRHAKAQFQPKRSTCEQSQSLVICGARLQSSKDIRALLCRSRKFDCVGSR